MRRPKQLNLNNLRETSSNPAVQSGNPILYYYPGAEEEVTPPSPTYERNDLNFAAAEPETTATPRRLNLHIEIPELESEVEDSEMPLAPRAADTVTAHHLFYAPMAQNLDPLDTRDYELQLERQNAEYLVESEEETSKSEPSSPASPLIHFLPIEINDAGLFVTEEAIHLQIGTLDDTEEAGLTFSSLYSSATF